MPEITATTLDPGHSAEVKVPDIVPILPNVSYVLYPAMIAPLVVTSESELAMIDEASRGDRVIGVFAVRPEVQEQEGADLNTFDAIYRIGTAAAILKMLKIPDGSVRLLVHGLRRIRIKEELTTSPYMKARVTPLPIITADDDRTKASIKNALKLLESYVDQTPLPSDLLVAATNMNHPGRLADLIASNLLIPLPEQQNVLEMENPSARLLKVQELLTRELELVAMGAEIQSKIKSKMDKRQRDFFLREQLSLIRKELGEDEDPSEYAELKERLDEIRPPAPVKKAAERELERLKSIPMASPEYTVSRNYLGWILDLPWTKKTRDNINLKKAKKILDEDHYDLEKVKERILEYLAVIKLKKSLKGPILCLVGPPGTGKTSVGRSVARAMGRKFARLSLGGMRDEAEIRGHRRTYIGSMPGRIINAMRDCGTINPVIMLDEIDKIGADFRGDPASALLEVLDPEQNDSFTDHFLDVPYDLSKVLFITTANMLETIPPPLLDRMEVLRLSGYTVREKTQIARKYLIPRVLENTGLDGRMIEFPDEAVVTIIEDYTREAGLRNLEREINSVSRKVARERAEGSKKRVVVDRKRIEDTLGPKRVTRDDPKRAQTPGVAIGLAWTPAGGEILFIEANRTAADGGLMLTGQLGDVMRESAQAALTYLQSNVASLGISPKRLNSKGLHVHVPAGATPKDGPSAGIAMTLALASLVKDRPLRPNLAMTGEVTLKGAVLPVGGIKEKVLAAHRSGIRTLILPAENERDLIDVPEEVRQDLDFKFVDRLEQAIEIGFSKAPSPNGARANGTGGTTKRKMQRRKTASGRTARKSPKKSPRKSPQKPRQNSRKKSPEKKPSKRAKRR